jgi:hypothetical protein
MFPPGTKPTGVDETNTLLRGTQKTDTPPGKTKVGDRTLTVTPTKTPATTTTLVSGSGIDAGSASGVAAAQPFRADQIRLDDPGVTWGDAAGKSVGIAALVAGIGSAASAGAVAGAVALGAAGTVALPGLGTVAGAAAGAIVGGAVGIVVGLGSGIARMVAAKSERRASRHLQTAGQALQKKQGNDFSKAQKNNLERVSAGQWQKLLHVSSRDVPDKADRQAIRNQVFEAVANQGPDAARDVRKALIGTCVKPSEVKDPAMRAKLQSAARMMAAERGARAGKQFKRELLVLSKKTDLSKTSAEELCKLRLRSSAMRMAGQGTTTLDQMLDAPLGSSEFELAEAWAKDSDIDSGGAASEHQMAGCRAARELLNHPDDDRFDQAFDEFSKNHIEDPYTKLNIKHDTARAIVNAKTSSNISVTDKKKLVKEALDQQTRLFKARSGGFQSWLPHQDDPFKGTKPLVDDGRLEIPASAVGPSPAWMRAATAAQSLPSRRAAGAVASFIEHNTEALLQDGFWQADVGGVKNPSSMIDNIAPSLALNVLHRADQNGTLSAKDLADFNKALNPTNKPVDRSKDHRLPSRLAGSDMDENLKNMMAEAIKNTYGNKEEMTQGMFDIQRSDDNEIPSMNLDTSQQKQLDAAFEPSNNQKADAKIAALEKAVGSVRDDFADDLVKTFQGVFAVQGSRDPMDVQLERA